MKKFTIKNLSRAIAEQRISVRATTSDEIASDVQARIGKNSFAINSHADIMSDIGAAAIGKQLMEAERSKLQEFGMGFGEPFVVLDGFPTQPEMPPTPQMFHDDAVVQFMDCQLLGIIRLAGLCPLAYEYENFGHLIRNVAPVETTAGAVSSWGAKEPLDFHTDNGYEFEGKPCTGSPSPHFLCFAGLRNQDTNGNPIPTEILRVKDVVDNAGTRLVEMIQKPNFRIMPGQSNNRGPISNVPLLERDSTTNEWLLRFNANESQTVGLTTDAIEAVAALGDLVKSLDDFVIPITVTPGAFLLFDNYRVLHRRRAFTPGSDYSQARWLRRCFACRDLKNGQRLDKRHRPFVWK